MSFISKHPVDMRNMVLLSCQTIDMLTIFGLKEFFKLCKSIYSKFNLVYAVVMNTKSLFQICVYFSALVLWILLSLARFKLNRIRTFKTVLSQKVYSYNQSTFLLILSRCHFQKKTGLYCPSVHKSNRMFVCSLRSRLQLD